MFGRQSQVSRPSRNIPPVSYAREETPFVRGPYEKFARPPRPAPLPRPAPVPPTNLAIPAARVQNTNANVNGEPPERGPGITATQQGANIVNGNNTTAHDGQPAPAPNHPTVQQQAPSLGNTNLVTSNANGNAQVDFSVQHGNDSEGEDTIQVARTGHVIHILPPAAPTSTRKGSAVPSLEHHGQMKVRKTTEERVTPTPKMGLLSGIENFLDRTSDIQSNSARDRSIDSNEENPNVTHGHSAAHTVSQSQEEGRVQKN